MTEWKTKEAETEWTKKLYELSVKYNFHLEDLPDILEEYILVDNEIIEIKNNEHDLEVLQQRNNELARKLKECMRQKQRIINTIRDSRDNERTHIGFNVLNQLLQSVE